MQRTFAIVLSGFFVLVIASVSCAPPTTAPLAEPPIPVHFTTFTDDAKVFSISYPPEWEVVPSALSRAYGEVAKEYTANLNKGVSAEKVRTIFSAGLPTHASLFSATEGPYSASVNIVLAPASGSKGLDQLVEENMSKTKKMFQDYHEFSRIKTTVGGRRAIIVEENVTMFDMELHIYQMYMLDDKNLWVVSASSPSREFDGLGKDLDATVRSLRILK